MGSMFKNYDYVPNEYIPNNKCQKKIIANNPLKIPMEETNDKGEFIGFSWNYQDNIMLEFFTEGYVIFDGLFAETAEKFLQNKKFRIRVFNFRFEIIFEDIIDASIDCKYILPTQLSEMLIPNTYSIQVDCFEETDGGVKNVITMLDKKDFKVFVR